MRSVSPQAGPRITLVTSVPPNAPNRTVDGQSFQREYREACFNSWKMLGDKVISVNTGAEHGPLLHEFPDMTLAGVPRDGSEIAGRPLVYLEDMANAALASECEFVAISNADIFFHDVPQIRRLVSQLTRGKALVANRVNVDSFSEPRASTYLLGYDLFIIHKRDLGSLRFATRFLFGEPWWDVQLLVSLVLAGIEVEALDSAHVLHISHPENYPFERWVEVGVQSLNEMNRASRWKWLSGRSPEARKLAVEIRRFLKYVSRCGKPLTVHVLRMLAGRKRCAIDGNSLTNFHELVFLPFAWNRLGFSDSGQESIEKAVAGLEANLRSAGE